MEKKAKVICSVVGFLGLLSYALGIAAEITRIKDVIYHSTPSVSIWCWTPRTPQEQDHVLWHPLLLLCGALSLFKCCCLLPSFCAYPYLVSIQMGRPQRPPLQYPPPQFPPQNIEAPVVLNIQT